jgi:hypothetical protein
MRTEIDQYGYGGWDILECGHTKHRASLDAGTYKRRCDQCLRAAQETGR